MKRNHALAAAAVLFCTAVVLTPSCQTTKSSGPSGTPATRAAATLTTHVASDDPRSDPHHADKVMRSSFCASCHPDIYAEHAQNTHGRAFTDEEVRLATGRFDQGDCIRCHTPRPVFETGIGMNPIRRWHDLEEGNTCMTCHWKADYDYAAFTGGAQCKEAFDPRVGTVEACASCHRNHGTPYQWELAPTGKAANRKCTTCHMAILERPVAVGQPPSKVHSHVFPASRSEAHLKRAYRYEARIDGNEAVVTVENRGAGHNFPTELKQRAVESLVIVRDLEGKEIARSRLVFRDPYKRPYGLVLPVNTQIPAGESREHRVPLPVAAGTVDCELHYKLYYPIEDYHPDLARRLEARRLVFDGITPSTKPIESDPEVRVKVPESIPPEVASPADLVDFARPPIGKMDPVPIPTGDDAESIRHLIELFQFPLGEANKRARDRLVEIGSKAVPALVEGLGSWDNKTFNQSMAVLARIGAPAEDAVLAALRSDQLYVRFHARALIPSLAYKDRRTEVIAALQPGLGAAHALDRASAAEALGKLAAGEAVPGLIEALQDRDPDVVRAAARALAATSDRGAAPAIAEALARAYWPEIQCDLAAAAGALGSTAGVQTLLAGLDYPDDLVREKYFENWFAVTGVHLGYDPLEPRNVRLERIAALQMWWASEGDASKLRRPPTVAPKAFDKAWAMVDALGGGSGTAPPGDDEKLKADLIAMGEDAVPALVLGLKFPPGFDQKRALICEILGHIGSPEAAPALIATLRDPVFGVSAWACWALEGVRDPATRVPLTRYRDRLLSAAAASRLPESAGPLDRLLMQSARSRLLLGDQTAAQDLIPLLLSEDEYTRTQAIDALGSHFGDRRGYDPAAEESARRAAAARWSE